MRYAPPRPVRIKGNHYICLHMPKNIAEIARQKVNRSKLADSGFEKLGKLPNPSDVLRKGEKHLLSSMI